MTNEKNHGTELSDEELMELTGGFVSRETVSSRIIAMLYGIPIALHGIITFYGIFPAQAITTPETATEN